MSKATHRIEDDHADRSAREVRLLQSTLLDWFAREKRDLPWRRTTDPYAIWLSEVMLQQTQVVTVIPYWERFIARFPTLHALAEAPVEDVLALWTGLGYYARARNLHRAAQVLVERHDGIFPDDLAALEALPGFGPYTAGAVASLALGMDAALVDGNVARVLCRVEGWELGSEEARARSWKHAPTLLPAGRCGDWNQALMELGATVCTPANPRCDVCPVASLCRAAIRGEPGRFPLPKVRPEKKLLRLSVLAVRDESGRVLLRRREERGLFGGLWELPGVEIDPSENAPHAASELAAELLTGRIRLESMGSVSRTLTHRRVEAEVFEAHGGRLRPEADGRWIAPPELPNLGLSTFAVKTLELLDVPAPTRTSVGGTRDGRSVATKRARG